MILALIKKKEKFNNNLYLSSPTRCFSCEQEAIKLYGPEYAFLGKPSKCFSCEKQLINEYGPNEANIGHGTKCFSCENQYK